jgi:hypothetical protein
MLLQYSLLRHFELLRLSIVVHHMRFSPEYPRVFRVFLLLQKKLRESEMSFFNTNHAIVASESLCVASIQCRKRQISSKRQMLRKRQIMASKRQIMAVFKVSFGRNHHALLHLTFQLCFSISSNHIAIRYASTSLHGVSDSYPKTQRILM